MMIKIKKIKKLLKKWRHAKSSVGQDPNGPAHESWGSLFSEKLLEPVLEGLGLLAFWAQLWVFMVSFWESICCGLDSFGGPSYELFIIQTVALHPYMDQNGHHEDSSC